MRGPRRHTRADDLAVDPPEHDAESKVGGITPPGGPVAHNRDATPLVEDRLQGGRHRLRHEIEGVHEVALAGPVSTDQESGVIKMDAFAGYTAKSLENQSWNEGVHHLLPRDRQEHGIEQPFFVAALRVESRQGVGES